MKTIRLTIPELGVIASTRGILGAGIALLLADRMSVDQRKAVGWTLFLIGALISIPLGAGVLGKLCASKSAENLPSA
jgi:4-amino-4-deoxy-L-arabinose transferase-like glycosyltransferase